MAKAKRRKRPNGYWRSWENLEWGLRGVIVKLGYFPSQRELVALGRQDILSASTTHHSGLQAVRARMGYAQSGKPQGYWEQWENLERELSGLIAVLGHFPTQNEFATLGRMDILRASKSHHCGLPAVRARMGYGQIQKPKGYWRNWENFERELRESIEKFGRFPSEKELKALGRHDITSASSKYYDGLHAVRERMGYEQVRKPNGYWQQWENFKRELDGVIEELGHFPSKGELVALGRKELIFASKPHGGLPAVREKMGYEQIRKPNGYWQRWENFERELDGTIEELGHFPSAGELIALGRRDVLDASSHHHDGLPAVRARMGYEQARKPPGYWQQWDHLKHDLKKVIEELGHFPSAGELIALGHRDVVHASQNYHGGLSAVRARMGCERVRKPRGYWQQWENFKQELDEVIEELGHFPSIRELVALGRREFIYASRPHGGLHAVRERMGFKQVKKPSAYWRDWDNLKRELQGVTNELGYFPSTGELAALGRSDIIHAAQDYHDGLPTVRERMGYDQIKKPNGYWQQWTNFERELRKIIAELGHFPSSRGLKALGRQDILGALHKHHGGLHAIRARMGYGLSPRATAAKLHSLATIPGLTDDEFVAVAQTFPGLESVPEDILLKHRTRLNLGPLELPPGTLDGGGVAFWERCLEELQTKHPAPERLEELWVLERIAARLHRAASIEVLGREPVTAEDEQRVVEFLEERARQKLDAAAPK